MLSMGVFISVNFLPTYVLWFYCFSLYAKLKKEEEEREAEWAKKYRDRVGITHNPRHSFKLPASFSGHSTL